MVDQAEELFQILSKQSRHPVKLRNLSAIHSLCRGMLESKNFDFSITQVGKALEAQGVITQKALTNPSSHDYRALIAAWRERAEKQRPRADGDGDGNGWLLRIPEVATRQLVQLYLAELRHVKGQLEALRRHQSPVVVLGSAARAHGSPGTSATSVELTDSQWEALRKATDGDYLASKGLVAGQRGEVLEDADRGRVLFERGFLTGLKALLEAHQKH